MAGSNESVAHAFVATISRQDVEALAELMTPDHRFVDSLGNLVEGREKVCAGWARYFKMVPDYTLTIGETYSKGSIVVMMGRAQGTYCPDRVLSHDHIQANHWQTPAAFRAAIEGDKVGEWRVFADNDPIRKLMGAH